MVENVGRLLHWIGRRLGLVRVWKPATIEPTYKVEV